ncbi:uncharacterized protein A4U43_C08F25900 [Asparagus officinalis]|nr:uncharacterized protein A4U43_C08F25900 [Asparagus officinalis]
MASIPCAIHLYAPSSPSSISSESQSQSRSPVEKLFRKSFGWVRASLARPKVGPISVLALDQNDVDQICTLDSNILVEVCFGTPKIAVTKEVVGCRGLSGKALGDGAVRDGLGLGKSYSEEVTVIVAMLVMARESGAGLGLGGGHRRWAQASGAEEDEG